MSEDRKKEPRKLTLGQGEGSPIGFVRNEINHVIEQTSLRGTAREVGLSPTGLQRFADGGAPYRETRRKLLEWYARREAQTIEDGLSPNAAAAALDLLVHDVPRHRRAAVRRQILQVLRDAHARSRANPPTWLT